AASSATRSSAPHAGGFRKIKKAADLPGSTARLAERRSAPVRPNLHRAARLHRERLRAAQLDDDFGLRHREMLDAGRYDDERTRRKRHELALVERAPERGFERP